MVRAEQGTGAAGQLALAAARRGLRHRLLPRCPRALPRCPGVFAGRWPAGTAGEVSRGAAEHQAGLRAELARRAHQTLRSHGSVRSERLVHQEWVPLERWCRGPERSKERITASCMRGDGTTPCCLFALLSAVAFTFRKENKGDNRPVVPGRAVGVGRTGSALPGGSTAAGCWALGPAEGVLRSHRIVEPDCLIKGI